MWERARDVVTSAVVLSVVGYVIWPPGDVPWRWVIHLPDPIAGDLEIAVLVLLVTATVGFGMTSVSGIRLPELAIGGVLAYAFWLAVLTLAFSSHEPLLPFIAYGLVLVGVLLGAVVRTALDHRSNVENRTRPS